MSEPRPVLTRGLAPRTRRAQTFLEVMAALMVLALGVLPVLDLLSASRRSLTEAREVLLLETRALEALETGRATLAELAHVPTWTGQEIPIEGEQGEVRWRVRARIIVPGVLAELRVRTETDDRYFELSERLALPWGAFYRSEGLPDEGAEP